MAHSWTGLVLALALFTAGDLLAQIRTRASGDFWSSAGFIYTEGSGNDTGRIGASLGWRCSGRRLQVVYGWGRYFVGSGGTVVVTFSTDDGEARSSRWRLNPNNLAATMPEGVGATFTREAKA